MTGSKRSPITSIAQAAVDYADDKAVERHNRHLIADIARRYRWTPPAPGGIQDHTPGRVGNSSYKRR